MAVTKEWRCPNYHEFSSEEPICPECGMEQGVVRVFLTPVGVKSAMTKYTDRKLDSLAKTYGLTDMSNKDGAPVNKTPQNVQWGGQQASSNALKDFKNLGHQPDNALAPLKDSLPSLASMTRRIVAPE